MPIGSPYLFVATMNVEAEHEAVFNEIYDTEHIPYLSSVPGVRSITRFALQDLSEVVGENGVMKTPPNEPRYTAIYEIDDPQVLGSADWARMLEKGRWPMEVRPFTSDRKHMLLARMATVELRDV